MEQQRKDQRCRERSRTVWRLGGEGGEDFEKEIGAVGPDAVER